MLPYHEQALGQTWAEASPTFQALYVTMCRAIGVPTMIAALALLALLLSAWRRGEAWARVAVPALTLGYGLPMLAITIWVRLETGAETPVLPLALGNVVTLVAALLSRTKRPSQRMHPRSTAAQT